LKSSTLVFLADDEDRLAFSVPLSRLFFAPGDMPLKDLASDTLLYVHVRDR